METKVKFMSENDIELSGVLHQASGMNVKAYAILAHCFTCTKSLMAGRVLARTLAQHGIAALRFDFTGLGASKGQFSKSSFSSNVADLQSAAQFLAENYEPAELMVGHSLGGTAVLAASQLIDSVKAVATIGSPASPDHILHLLSDSLDDIAASPEGVTVNLAGRDFIFKQSFVDDVRGYDLDIGSIGKALMVLHAPMDGLVSIDQAGKIFTSAKHPKSFASLDKGDHLLTKAEDATYAANMIAPWALRFVAAKNASVSDHNGVTATGETGKAFLTHMHAASHHFLADEPLSYGGTNEGPTPYDFLGAALGACTSMTLNMYARRKKLEVKSVSVNVTHEKIHAEDCDDCEKSDGQIDQFTRRISIAGNLNDAQHKRMLEIADKCPVHKTLENEIKILTQEA